MLNRRNAGLLGSNHVFWYCAERICALSYYRCPGSNPILPKICARNFPFSQFSILWKNDLISQNGDVFWVEDFFASSSKLNSEFIDYFRQDLKFWIIFEIQLFFRSLKISSATLARFFAIFPTTSLSWAEVDKVNLDEKSSKISAMFGRKPRIS